MNIEELKLVLQTIQGISGDASSAAIVWMALHYGTQVLGVIATAGTLLGGIYVVAQAFLGQSEWAELAKRVCSAYGCDDDYTYATAEQKRALRRAIEKAAK